MIQMRSILEVADNSGPKKWVVLRFSEVRGGGTRLWGDIIVVSVKDALPNSKIRKGDVVRAVIVRTKKEVKRLDGSYIKLMTTQPFSSILKENPSVLEFLVLWPGIEG